MQRQQARLNWSVETYLNPYEGLKPSWIQEALGACSVETYLNPYEGLKQVNDGKKLKR